MCIIFQHHCVMDDVIYTLILGKMSMIIAPCHTGITSAVLARIIEICPLILPTVCIQRSLGGQICHRTFRRLCNTIIVPLLASILPVITVGIVKCSVDIIQLTGLAEIWCVDRHKLTVKGQHILAQSYHLWHLAMNRTFVGSTATKSQPAYAIVIDDNAWVKRCRTILQSRHILIYKRLSQRITPTLHWICGCDNTYTLSTICKIQIKMSQAILLNTGSDGWRPGIDNPWCNLPHFDSSMINPVGHIIGRKYHQ